MYTYDGVYTIFATWQIVFGFISTLCFRSFAIRASVWTLPHPTSAEFKKIEQFGSSGIMVWTVPQRRSPRPHLCSQGSIEHLDRPPTWSKPSCPPQLPTFDQWTSEKLQKRINTYLSQVYSKYHCIMHAESVLRCLEPLVLAITASRHGNICFRVQSKGL